jgi:predicted  nucleic acid-binding Zn-ribbon protein
MVRAHLENVKTVLLDLETQKQNIEQEIVKLTDYLQRGRMELSSFENSVTLNNVTNNDVSSVSTKKYLGD